MALPRPSGSADHRVTSRSNSRLPTRRRGPRVHGCLIRGHAIAERESGARTAVGAGSVIVASEARTGGRAWYAAPWYAATPHCRGGRAMRYGACGWSIDRRGVGGVSPGRAGPRHAAVRNAAELSCRGPTRLDRGHWRRRRRSPGQGARRDCLGGVGFVSGRISEPAHSATAWSGSRTWRTWELAGAPDAFEGVDLVDVAPAPTGSWPSGSARSRRQRVDRRRGLSLGRRPAWDAWSMSRGPADTYGSVAGSLVRVIARARERRGPAIGIAGRSGNLAALGVAAPSRSGVIDPQLDGDGCVALGTPQGRRSCCDHRMARLAAT